jgi:hypothetical protein
MTRIPKTLPPNTRSFAQTDETMAYYMPLPFCGRLCEISALEQMYGYYFAE